MWHFTNQLCLHIFLIWFFFLTYFTFGIFISILSYFLLYSFIYLFALWPLNPCVPYITWLYYYNWHNILKQLYHVGIIKYHWSIFTMKRSSFMHTWVRSVCNPLQKYSSKVSLSFSLKPTSQRRLKAWWEW